MLAHLKIYIGTDLLCLICSDVAEWHCLNFDSILTHCNVKVTSQGRSLKAQSKLLKEEEERSRGLRKEVIFLRGIEKEVWDVFHHNIWILERALKLPPPR